MVSQRKVGASVVAILDAQDPRQGAPSHGIILQPLLGHLLRPLRYARRALCVAFYKCPFRLGAEFANCMNALQQSPHRGRHATLRPEDCAGSPTGAHEHPLVAAFARAPAEASPPHCQRIYHQLLWCLSFASWAPSELASSLRSNKEPQIYTKIILLNGE